MDTTKKKKTASKSFYIYITLSSLLVVLLVFFLSYKLFLNHTYSKYESKIKNYIIDINSLNNSTYSLIKNGQYNPDNVKTGLSKIIASLSSDKNKINAIRPDSEYVLVQNNLISGITNNINMYRQITLILSNPKASDISSSFNDLKKYEDSCIQYYSNVKLRNLSISLPSNSVKFTDKSIYYINNLVKDSINSQVKLTEKNNFLGKVDEILNKLVPVKTDYDSEVENARNGSKSYSDVKKAVDDAADVLNDLKDSYNKISVPSDAVGLYKSLGDVLNNYYSYIKDFSLALSNEILINENNMADKSDESSLYNISSDDLKKFNTSYDTFTKIYSDYKNSKN